VVVPAVEIAVEGIVEGHRALLCVGVGSDGAGSGPGITCSALTPTAD
jgi:hypothetical protein